MNPFTIAPGSSALGPDLRRIQQRALIVGVVGLAFCLVGAVFNPAQFFRSYLLSYMLWTGVALGCLAILMLQYLSGGMWGLVIRRLLESATRTLPLMALLFVLVALGLRTLYVWARPEAVAASEALRHKQSYLNVWFFLIRAVAYFAVWIGVSHLLNKWSRQQDETDDVKWRRRLQLLSGPGLVLYGLTVTFASIDWIMSLEPEWFSTIFGVLIMGGQGVSAIAFIIVVSFWLVQREPKSGVFAPARFHDLGNILLTFVMLWAYFAFSQLLIIWSGNLPEEIPWYLYRLQSGWRGVGILLVVFHFALPFLLLLSRDFKHSARRLALLAAGILLMRVVDLLWLIAPRFHQKGLYVHWMDFVAPIGLGGLWLAFFLHQLKQRPLLPLQDPYLKEVLDHGSG